MPHVHILLWLAEADKIHPDDIDKFVCAEIPDKEEDPALFKLVTELMIHGPCGKDMLSKNSCFIDNKCSKEFPKAF